MGRERGPAGQEGEAGRPSRTPPPPPLNICPPLPRSWWWGQSPPLRCQCAEAMAPTPRCHPPTPPPLTQELVGGALCRAEPSHACGSCPMQGGTLHKGAISPLTPPGGVAPLVSGSRPRHPCAAEKGATVGLCGYGSPHFKNRMRIICLTRIPPVRLDAPKVWYPNIL